VSDRIDQLTTEQARVVAYLSFSHYYGQQSMPAAIFSVLLGAPRNKPIDLRKHLSPAIDLLVQSAENEWRTAHPIIAETCMKHILRTRGSDPETWKYQLASFAKDFASCCRGDTHTHPTISEECLNIVRRVFVYRDNAELMGTEYSSRGIFSPLMEQLPAKEAKLEVYRHLTEVFPDEAHFWAHLSRLLLIEFKKFDEAEKAISKALDLNPEDHVIHHMSGMIQRGKVYDLIQKDSPLAEVVDAAEVAARNFAEARKLGPEDEHGYISEVQLIIKVLEYSRAVHGLEPTQVAALHDSPRWLRESLQLAEHLLSELRQLRIKDKPSHYENSCRADLDIVYGDFNNALQLWDNLLSRKDIYAPPVRRQLVWTYLARRKHDWNALQPKEIGRIRELLDKNLQEESGSDRDLRLWLQIIRRDTNPPTLEAVIEQVAYWRSVSDSLDSIYYLYVLYALQVLGGSDIEAPRMYEYLNQSRDRSRFRRQRNWSFEWLGEGHGIVQLVHQNRLAGWNDEIDFWSDTQPLKRIVGVIKRIQGPHAGEIELPGGITAFFVPGKSIHVKGADENRRVGCFIGFSYDGLRAWSVRNE
jgi:tetratricopeptide (TPR) repeat protein